MAREQLPAYLSFYGSLRIFEAGAVESRADRTAHIRSESQSGEQESLRECLDTRTSLQPPLSEGPLPDVGRLDRVREPGRRESVPREREEVKRPVTHVGIGAATVHGVQRVHGHAARGYSDGYVGQLLLARAVRDGRIEAVRAWDDFESSLRGRGLDEAHLQSESKRKTERTGATPKPSDAIRGTQGGHEVCSIRRSHLNRDRHR